MLRKRSRAVSSTQGLMADQASLASPSSSYTKPISSFFSSPRLFTGFSAKGFSDSEAAMSPTSILDSKPFSGLANPFWSDRTLKSPEASTENKHPWAKLDSKGVGLGIVDALSDKDSDKKFSKPESRMVLFGSQLKIQIPPLPPSAISASVSPQSSIEFGASIRNSISGSFSPGLSQKTLLESTGSGPEMPISPPVFTGCLSASEMELSEDYTCVISRGPNPKTTHIFENCIVESCGVGEFSASRNENLFFNDQPGYPSDNFLTYCCTCKKNLGQGKDIFMYRGEKAFCSRECRYQEMLFDEGMERCESDPSVTLYDDIFDPVRTFSDR